MGKEIDKFLKEWRKNQEKNQSYLQTPKGRADLKEALEKSHRKYEDLRNSHNIPYEDWTTPFGPADGSGIWNR